ncbi:hypothetical protein F5882DRAFT_380482 [Hyaloscypha sp. PMI_1271]|nr:hypothetical protein F5882DRAFT_380482 [Hyaloscypha sp. PMI_1271]
MLQENGFDCISYVFHSTVPIKLIYRQFPTWVPTFSNSFILPFCKLRNLAAGGDLSQQRYSIIEAKLKTKAFKIDRISKVYPKFSWGSFEVDSSVNKEYTDLDWIWKEFVRDGKSLTRYRTGCSIRTAFALTITGGLRGWASTQDFTTHEKAFTEFSKHLFKNTTTTSKIRKSHRPMTLLRIATAATALSFQFIQEDSMYENRMERIKMQGGSKAGKDPDEQVQQQQLEDYQYFQRAVQSACNNRCLFVTESGYIGLGPHVISEECPDFWDERSGVHPELNLEGKSLLYEIWVLPGARTPFVLQPQEKSYLLIGLCEGANGRESHKQSIEGRRALRIFNTDFRRNGPGEEDDRVNGEDDEERDEESGGEEGEGYDGEEYSEEE